MVAHIDSTPTANAPIHLRVHVCVRNSVSVRVSLHERAHANCMCSTSVQVCMRALLCEHACVWACVSVHIHKIQSKISHRLMQAHCYRSRAIEHNTAKNNTMLMTSDGPAKATGT